MNPQDWKLILLALIAITSLIVLITKAKVNAFHRCSWRLWLSV